MKYQSGKLKHSPGPWKDAHDRIEDVEGNTVVRLKIETNQDVCNARLIAAAPYMFHYLEEIAIHPDFKYEGKMLHVLFVARGSDGHIK